MTPAEPERRSELLAVIGLGCRFPGASGPEEYWRLLREGRSAVGRTPRDRWGASSGSGGFLSGVDRFDADFFWIPRAEAHRIDPQQRLLLEVAWEALDDAGLNAERLRGSATGVFIGMTSKDYFRIYDTARINGHELLGNASAIAANRISYFLDLRGPSIAIDTTCSSSLVAVHLACRSLELGECNLAFVGGVNLILIPDGSMCTGASGMNSAEGSCKVFDARADGMVRGEGAGVVVLKRLPQALADGDRVYAVIRGSAMNQNGLTNGLAAPSPQAQVELLRAAYRCAGVHPSRVDYIEAHAVGTPLGDAVEARALGAVVSEQRPSGRPCRIGSVKANIGHLEAASGIAGLIKLVLSLAHREIPPCVNLSEPNPQIPFEQLGLSAPRALTPWPPGEEPSLGGVSSFGLGGCNCHIVVEQAPPAAVVSDAASPEIEMLPVSARSPQALHELVEAVRRTLAERDLTLSDVCYTARSRRTHHPHRAIAVGRSREELICELDAVLERSALPQPRPRRPRLAFVFSQFGDTWTGAGRELCRREAAFQKSMEECRAAFGEHGWPGVLDPIVDPSRGAGSEGPEQVAALAFATQVGVAAVWRDWGIRPQAVVGEGLGELAAAHAAGALALGEAAKIVLALARAREGAGGVGGIAAAAESAGAGDLLKPVARRTPSVPCFSSMASREEAGPGQASRRWSNRIIHAGSIQEALQSMLKAGCNVFIEIGADQTAAARVAGVLESAGAAPTSSVSSSLHRAPREGLSMCRTLGSLYVSGVSIDWRRSHPLPGRCVGLSAYPWQRERFWYEYRAEDEPFSALPEGSGA